MIEAAPQRVAATVRTRAYAPALWVGVVVVASTVARAWAARFHAGPAYFPDEYIYSELGRSLAAHGQPLIRGEPAHFAPLLAPLVTAPGWLFGSVVQGYHTVQAINAFVMSLAAIPAYLLVCWVGLGRRVAYAASLLAVLAPGMLYTSFMLSEPIAYPLVLAAAATAVRALARPSGKSVGLFLGFVGLATFARMQFAVLLPCYLVALVALLAREGRFLETIRSHRRAAAALVLLTAGLAALGPGRSTGYYPSFLHTSNPGRLASELALNGLVLVFAAGVVIVPGAILGVFFAISRPRSRAELALALFTLVTTIALLLQASLYGDTTVAQERYAFYLLPLWLAGFLLYADRGWPKKLVHGAVSLVVVVAIFSTPLTTEAFGKGKVHSPVLFAVARLQESVQNPGSTSQIVALIGVVLILAVAAAAAVPAVRTPVAVAAAGGIMLATTLAAYSFDAGNTSAVRSAFVGADPSWIDASGVRPAALIATPGGLMTDSLEQLFWNRSVDRIALFPGAKPTDLLTAGKAGVRSDGTVVVDGKPVDEPVVMNEFGSSVQLENASRLGADATSVLYRPHGRLKIRLLAVGHYHDDWVAPRGVVYLWPSAGSGGIAGRVVWRFRVPEPEGAVSVVFTGGGTNVRTGLAAGRAQTVSVPVCSRGPVAISFRSSTYGGLGDGRLGFAQAPAPRFTADATACS